jgi:hypothetical protein
MIRFAMVKVAGHVEHRGAAKSSQQANGQRYAQPARTTGHPSMIAESRSG